MMTNLNTSRLLRWFLRPDYVHRYIRMDLARHQLAFYLGPQFNHILECPFKILGEELLADFTQDYGQIL